MLIWQGKGILVIVPFVFIMLFTALILDHGLGLETELSFGFGMVLGGVVGGALLWWFDRWLEQRNPPRTLVDQQTGQQIVVKRRDTFFFIPMKFIAYLYPLTAIGGFFLMLGS